ncbi:LysR family transcriptional regulator [Phytohalomonas tamaricis]|uniref:LysR family transcriptional regulator n=1 Tax=Phytohalomonas tamaricis TaxID=2081032 RepID=UPI000D0B3BF7|nr:LysR family transcriptional regulator [Phytohalomonas tamaricis]
MPAFSRSDLADLNVFTTIVRRRSFKAAAIEHGVTTSALSHKITKLEEKLGVRLLNRTNRTVVPTPIGITLAQKLEEGFQHIGEALGELEIFRTQPVGELRLNVPRDAAKLLIGPVLFEFAEAYPHVQLAAAVEDRPVDIIAEGFDAGIRYGDTVPEDMVTVALTPPLRWVVVASPVYLARHGRPQHPDDLLTHACIGVRLGNNSPFKWELGDDDAMLRLEVQGPFSVNDTDLTIEAALNGVGLAYLLERRVKAELQRGSLEIVMDEWASTGPGFQMYYSSRKQTQPGLNQLTTLIRAREGLASLSEA